MKNKMRLSFEGGAGTVTGANFLLEDESGDNPMRILVDCGLEQGSELCDGCNYEPFAYNPSDINVLLVTHAHLDHIGRIPKLVKDGFRGTIYSTPSTKEISEVMFKDSVHLLAEEAKKLAVKPLFEERDVVKTLSLWQTASYHEETDIGGGIHFNFKDAGHILGSAMVEISRAGRKIVFTGDLGNSPTPLLRDTEVIDDAQYLVMESVYGDRNHEPREDRIEKLKKVIERVVERKGTLLIPAFSIERTQIILYELNHLVEEKKVPEIPVYLDSPLAIKVTEIYKNKIKNFKESVQSEIKLGDDIFDFPNLHFTRTRKESKEIAGARNPKIIIAGSGMSHGGRIIFHEKVYLSNPNNTILFVGFQAAGYIGRRILEGEKNVDIFGKKIPVRAHIESIMGYSAHKDSTGLQEFASHSADTLEQAFVVMGEPKSAMFLTQRLRDYYGIEAIAPQKGDTFELAL